MRSGVALLVACAIAACGSDDDCRPAYLAKVDETRACALPYADVPDLRFCHPAGRTRTKGVRPIRVVVGPPNAARYVGYIGTDEHAVGVGAVTEGEGDPLPPPLGDGGCPP
jgi:hypothetical protein